MGFVAVLDWAATHAFCVIDTGCRRCRGVWRGSRRRRKGPPRRCLSAAGLLRTGGHRFRPLERRGDDPARSGRQSAHRRGGTLPRHPPVREVLRRRVPRGLQPKTAKGHHLLRRQLPTRLRMGRRRLQPCLRQGLPPPPTPSASSDGRGPYHLARMERPNHIRSGNPQRRSTDRLTQAVSLPRRQCRSRLEGWWDGQNRPATITSSKSSPWKTGGRWK